MSIEVRGIVKRFGPFTALQNVSLTVNTGELVGLLGPSGSGKTSLLRVIAGLEIPEDGSVWIDGLNSAGTRAWQRRVGFVFQHYALFRHLTVFENVAFGLRVRPRTSRPGEAEIRERVHRLLDLIQLDVLADRYPSQLSGGQRQRVALARALAVEPTVLLLDEPFGALDAKVRKELRRWLRRLHDQLRVTSVFVTHDQDEALELSDRVVIMNQGRLEQVGTPEEVYNQPASLFVYNFLGDVNLFRGRVEGNKAYLGGLAVDLPEGTAPGHTARLYIRPHLLEIETEPAGPGRFRARVVHVNPAGPLVKVELVAEWGEPVRVELSQERYQALGLKPETDVFIYARDPDHFVRETP
jgi:sulfate/thiosulfate transport system ATP-binding protein